MFKKNMYIVESFIIHNQTTPPYLSRDNHIISPYFIYAMIYVEILININMLC